MLHHIDHPLISAELTSLRVDGVFRGYLEFLAWRMKSAATFTPRSAPIHMAGFHQRGSSLFHRGIH
jgi:hypothetical protein